MAHKEKDFRIRVSKRLYESVYKMAQSLEMSISEYVRYVLRKEIEK
jgi:predicted HicB family RNase H-like nuclease